MKSPALTPSRSTFGALIAASALIIAACGSDSTESAANTTTSNPATPTTAPATTRESAGDTTSAQSSTDPATPTEVLNCGITVPTGSPERVITLNQGATEIALALGFADQIIGTAYLDDEILRELADDYATIEVISDEYPSTEVIFDAEPDFLYASYRSAFGPEVAGDREDLAAAGVGSYLSPASCPDRAGTDEALSFDLVFSEFTDIATLFGDPAAGEALVAEQQAILDASFAADNADVTVFWWDGGIVAPTAGVCCGAPGMIMNAAGVTNIFGDTEGSWSEVSWEAVIDADPDVIVLVDASWDLAADKQAHLESDAALSRLRAVAEQRYIVIPFSATTPGIRNAEVVGDLAALINQFEPAN